MSELVRTMPGYISHKSFYAEDGERCTIVEFENEEGLRTWRTNPEHLVAQKMARQKYYTEYSVQVCTLDRESKFKLPGSGGADLTLGREDFISLAQAIEAAGPAMEKFTVLEGVAAPLKMINVDTDMIIPKQYLKTIKRTGLGKGLFAEKRYRDDGGENPDFVLNKPAYRRAKILVAGDNFGCGSSREHAPWALKDFGIKCVISTSFGDIFYNNCFKNGVLPIKVSPEDLDKLFDDAERGANATLSIDLEKQEIRGPDGGVVRFDIEPHRKHALLNGLDDIGLTMRKQDKIERFEHEAKSARPWV